LGPDADHFQHLICSSLTKDAPPEQVS